MAAARGAHIQQSLVDQCSDARVAGVNLQKRLFAPISAFHCVGLRPNPRRSACVSSARASALSSTNSLTERCETAAAACSARLALRVVLAGINSSFSLDINRFARQCQDKHAIVGARYAGPFNVRLPKIFLGDSVWLPLPSPSSPAALPTYRSLRARSSAPHASVACRPAKCKWLINT
jgi:hypothetical protein